MTMPEEEKKQPVVPPPPPEEQEYFPGFKLEATQLAKGRYQAQKRLAEASRGLEKVKRTGITGGPLFNLLTGVVRISDFRTTFEDILAPEEALKRYLLESRQAVFEATRDYAKVSWRQQVLQSLPIVLLDRQSGIRSIDDVMTAFPNEFIDDSDQQWLQGIWNKAEGLIPPELPPEFVGTPEEARTQLLEAILRQPKLELRGVHHLTVDELLRSFQPRAPELPKGMNTEDVRSILKDLQFDEETQKQIEDIHELAGDLVNDWKCQVAYMDLLRSGVEQAEVPELTPVEFLKMTFTQPALAALELLEKYFNMLSRPLAALAVMAFPRIRKDSDAAELETLYNQYKDLGENWWQAASLAYQDWDTNLWLKLYVETVFDPTTYIGLGILSRITKPLPYIGKFSAGLERGWIEMWDLPFRGARSIIKRIPKTPGQHALSYARQAFLDSRAFLRRATGRNVDSLSKSEVVDSFKLAINQAAEMPHETGDWAVRTGRYLIDHDFFTDTQVKDMLTTAGVKKPEITKQLVMDFNYNWDRFFYKAQTAKEAAADILAHAGTEPTEAVLGKLVTQLEKQRTKIIDGATDIVRGDTAKEVLDSVFRNVEDLQLRKVASPVYDFVHKSGRATSWITRTTDKIIHNNLSMWVDRHITAPMSNQYLLFTNYGPFNVMESVMRSFLGAGELFYPRAASPIDEVIRIGEGLSNLPYEFIQHQGRLGRLEMAVTDPKTGKTLVFSKGKVPFVTRKGPLGVTIKIGDKDYPIRSWQDWNDMFGDIGSQQRAWYYLTKYKQLLWDEAPDEMARIAKVFDDSEGLLAGIESFSKREKNDLRRVLEQDATVGPDMIRKHDVPVLEVERRRAAYEINKVMDKCTDIYSIHKQTIREEVLSGKIFKEGIDTRVSAVGDSIREFNVACLTHEADMLDRLVADLAEFVPENSDELLRTMGFISDLTEATGERISDVRQITRARAQKLTAKETEDFYKGSNEVLGEFIGKSNESVDEILTSIRRAVEDKKLLKPEQMTTLDNLSQAIRTRHANTLSTRELDRRIINEAMEQTPKAKRDKAFWEHLETRRSNEAWEPYWTREAELFEAVEDIKNRLMVDLGVTPDTVNVVPEVVDRLTPAHVAYMLGVTGDDLNKALTKVGAMVTIRPKRQFTTWIYSKAKKTASRVGKTPDDIGFSKEAIGDVYDQMFANLGFDPKAIADEPLTPTMSQLEEVRQELHRIEGVSKIPANDYVKYKGYVSKLADDLGRTPMYQVAPVEPLPVASRTSISKSLRSRGVAGDKLLDAEDLATELIEKGGIIDSNGMVTLYHRTTPVSAQKIVKSGQIVGKEGELFFGTSPTGQIEGYGDAVVQVKLPLEKLTLSDIFASEAHVTLMGRRATIKAELWRPKPIAATENWFAKKESAMMKTRTQFEMDFTDYSNANSVDAAMRMVFPFWQYEWQRWFWLPRQMLKTPGVGTGVGRYMDYSDQGYIPVPGTDIQFNPLRGTVFMGGFRRLYLRDFPEYYDAFPGMEIIDYISRLGFYPGIHVMAPIILFGAFQNKPEFGEVAPAWVKTPLNAARAIAPEQAGKIIDRIFPDRFRDYLTMLTLGKWGEDADAIWRKKSQGIKLTEEEEKMWLRAEAEATGLKGILFEQTGVFRLRPQEYTQIQRDYRELIAELTGVPTEVQETIQRRYPVTGKRFSDYYKLDSLQQKIIYEQEAYRRWQGVTTPLYPSTWQQEDAKVRDYYEKVELLYDDARHTGIFDEQGNLVQPAITELTRQWVSGEIGPDQWVSGRGEVLDHASAASLGMGKRDYPDVPKTLDQREARYKERGVPAPTYSPDQEMLYYYYELKPEYKWDWDRDRYAYDFDVYFAKIDALMESMQGEFRQRFEDRIQYDWTPMEKLYWQISREYLRPYRLIRNLVLEQYTPEQQELVRRYEVARGTERDEIRETPGPEGRKLISHFTSTLREARQRYRLLDPTTDAWAYFFGSTDTLLTTQAKETYKQIEKQYLTPVMIR